MLTYGIPILSTLLCYNTTVDVVRVELLKDAKVVSSEADIVIISS